MPPPRLSHTCRWWRVNAWPTRRREAASDRKRAVADRVFSSAERLYAAADRACAAVDRQAAAGARSAMVFDDLTGAYRRGRGSWSWTGR